MAAGDPGTRKRNYSATAIETTLVNSMTSAATGDTTTSVAVVSVSGFPSTVPYTLIIDPDGSKEEVVTVTAASSTTLTITRGQDNTQAQAHAAGTSVRHGVSAREFKELQTHIAARGYDTDSAILSGVDTHVHGLGTGDGDVVGTSKTQTLSKKTFSGSFTASAATFVSPTITSPTISGSPVITGLSSAGMSSSSATPKDYVDAILGSATAASTSAASAATSATSAATSATSAAASATASASSASAAATSASSALTSQTAAATSATSAAASATAAATSATSAATSATSSASSASAAATSASSAATSASSAATSATTAQAWATQLSTPVSGTDYSAKYNANLAATSATSAATSATSAATSATSAATSATASASSASAAATSASSAATSATAAATSATSAAASQTAAATSATSAAASATAAATSATSAAASATAAASSETNAAASYDSFDDRYLGSKVSPPSLDNDGNTLLVGAIYWNSNTSQMYAWTGSAWSAISVASPYSAPTLGNTTIGSGTTYTTVDGLSLTSATVTLANDPTNAMHAVTKQYADAIAAGVNTHDSVQAATTAAITGTYTAGSADASGGTGIGATFAVTATGALVVDGYTALLNDRILIKNQTDAKQNGIYKVTTAGTTGVSAVLTRATDYDNSIAGEVFAGDMVFVQNGTVNTNYGWLMNSSGTSTNPTKGIKIGTDNISWTQFAGNLGSQVKIDSGAATSYSYIDFVGMGTDTATSGTIKVKPVTATGADTGQRIYVGTTTPSSPTTGDIWIDATASAGADLTTMVVMGAY